MSGADGNDNESLVPHSHAVLGLKVADAEEEDTVRRLAMAVFGLIALLVLHFFVHVAHHGHVGHAVVHLLAAAVVPAVGYVAISQRSTKAAWAFHLMTVISSVIHAVTLIVVLVDLAQVQSQGDFCEKYSKPCEGDFIDSTPPMAFSPRKDFWRCSSGWCIDGFRRCDGKTNCFDRSDELGCVDTSTPNPWKANPRDASGHITPSLQAKEQQEMQLCIQLDRARHKGAPRLKWWWLLMSMPMWGLCILSAYYSLEFYVQLRVRRLSARVDRELAAATVFDRAEAAE